MRGALHPEERRAGEPIDMVPEHPSSKSRLSSQTSMFLFAVALPALVIVGLSVGAVLRYRVRVSYGSNVQLIAQDLAAGIEKRVTDLSVAALQDPQLSHLGSPHPRYLRLHGIFQALKERHPIAANYILLENDRVVYPYLKSPPPKPLSDYLRELDASTALGIKKRIKAAKRAEVRESTLPLAASAYEQIAEFQAPAALRGWALLRAAHCYRKLERFEKARALYRRILTEFAEEYEPAHTPLALSAGFALYDVASARADRSGDFLLRLQSDFVRGRWSLSAQEGRRLAKEFEKRLGPREAGAHSSALDYFELSLAFDRLRRRSSASRIAVNDSVVDEIGTVQFHAFAFSSAGRDFQTYYAVQSSDGSERMLVVVPNLEFIREEMVAQQLAAQQLERDVIVHVLPVQRNPRGTSSQEARAGFSTIFPSLEVVVNRVPRYVRSYNMLVDLGLFSAAMITLFLIGFGLRVLKRDLEREREMNKIKAEFIGGVSHDMKTPLTLIRLNAETLLDSPELNFSERVSLYNGIVLESERLLKLIGRVLDYSRIQRSAKVYRLAPGDLARSIALTVDLYTKYLERFGFSISYHPLRTRTWPPVRFDPEAISSVVINLLENAIKYSGQSRVIRLDLRVAGDALCLEIEDYGIGIPRVELENIFNAFYRIENGSGKGGCGLGLFLVQHIVTAHGGRIEVESEPGQGTRFRLFFPIATDVESEISELLPTSPVEEPGHAKGFVN